MTALAWTVTEPYEDRSTVVFAATADDAICLGAVELGACDEDITADRSPEFDTHAPGPVPVAVLLDAGWWWPCGWCEHELTADGCTCERHDEEPELVTTKWDAFCGEACRAELERARAEYQAAQGAA